MKHKPAFFISCSRALLLVACFLAFSPSLHAAPQIATTPAASSEIITEAPQILGIAQEKQLNFQTPYSPVMERLYETHNMLLVIIFAVSIFVLLVLLYIIVRFNRRANPVPSKTTHNTMLEIIWTTIPILILVAIAIPSVRAHYFMEKTPEEGITLKVTGHQWYWSYQYPDFGGFEYDSYMLADADAKAAGEPRLLGVDNRVVVPVNTPVRVQMTSADVIHSWAIPSFGVKRDAVPGRLNESWFEATKEGVFYGQCSELCGKLHGFMPIAVEVVSRDKFDAWIAQKQKDAGINPEELKAKDEGKPTAAADDKVVAETAKQEQKVNAEQAKDQAEVKPDVAKKPTASEAPAKPAEIPASDAVTQDSEN